MRTRLLVAVVAVPHVELVPPFPVHSSVPVGESDLTDRAGPVSDEHT